MQYGKPHCLYVSLLLYASSVQLPLKCHAALFQCVAASFNVSPLFKEYKVGKTKLSMMLQESTNLVVREVQPTHILSLFRRCFLCQEQLNNICLLGLASFDVCGPSKGTVNQAKTLCPNSFILLYFKKPS